MSGDGNRLYVAGNLDDTLRIVDPTSPTVLDTVAVGHHHLHERGESIGDHGVAQEVDRPTTPTLGCFSDREADEFGR